jgi:hypothetical protein
MGSNRLIRMNARGDDWQALGPDMTRANRQDPEPDVGNTSYHALFAIAESPRTAKVLWTGSDDGLVWVTRDGGATWANVTGNLPKDAPTRCFVSTIAASHHAEGTAYITYDCHHRDDYRPHVFRTADFGRTWTRIVNGLPRDAGSLAVFESPRNPRVLWVGTATGAYVTADAGRRWVRFGRNLPPVPVEKFSMSYRQRELVLGTHGRGIWTVNVAAMEEMSDTLLTASAYLFDVPPATQYRYSDTYPSFGSRPWISPAQPRGVEISYFLRDAQPRTLDLYVTTAAGDTVKKITAPGYAGLQRARWDLTSDKPRPREKGAPTTPAELKRVLPGEYVVTLDAGGRKLRRTIVVRDWPAEDRLGRVR